MPIEIRELIIRATVEDDNNGSENRMQGGLELPESECCDKMVVRIEELNQIFQQKNER